MTAIVKKKVIPTILAFVILIMKLCIFLIGRDSVGRPIGFIRGLFFYVSRRG